MSVPSRAQAGALIAGTLLAAAGLNLGVLSLGDPEPGTGSIEAAGAPIVVVADEASALPDPLVLESATVATEAAESQTSDTPTLEVPLLSSPADGSSVPWSAGHDDDHHDDEHDDDPYDGHHAPSSDPDNSTVELIDYEIPGVAKIVVSVSDGRRLEFESVTPADGWVSRTEDEDADELKVKFRRLSDGEEAEFEAEFEHGQLKVKLED